MLTKLICRNFKCFGEVEIELGNPVVFIGPNNSGKTTALHALALWEIGLKRWNEHRRRSPQAGRRRGITVNRRDLISVPVPNAKLLWHNLQVRNVQEYVRMDIIVEGVTASKNGNVVWNSIMPIQNPFTVALFDYRKRMVKYQNRCLFLKRWQISMLPSFRLCLGLRPMKPALIRVRLMSGLERDEPRRSSAISAIRLCKRAKMAENGTQSVSRSRTYSMFSW